MKITKSQLKNIIKEEIESTLEESPTRTMLRFNDGEYNHSIYVKGTKKMKITKAQLKQIIKEELTNLTEQDPVDSDDEIRTKID